jgi:hypothetical protein
MNIDSLIGSVMKGFDMTVVTDDDGKGGKTEKQVIIRKGNGTANSCSYSFNFDSLEKHMKEIRTDEDGTNTIIITTPDDKDGKGEKKVIIKKGSNGYMYNSDGEEIDIKHFEGDGEGKTSTIIITGPDEKNGKKVIVRSTVTVVDDADKKEGKRKERKKDGSSGSTQKMETADELKFYPNPSDGKFNVEYELKSKETAVLTIMDASGKELFRDEIKGGGKYSKQIDLGGKGKGVFVLNLVQGNKSISRKIVIE